MIANPPPPGTTQAPSKPGQKAPVVVAPQPGTTQTPPKPGQKAPVVVAPQPGTTQGPPSTPATQSNEARWTVYKDKKNGCMAAIKVECVPKATCNPPPPFKYACPDNVSLEKPITVVTYDGTNCFVQVEQPKCPPNMSCNPPPARKVACPTPNR